MRRRRATAGSSDERPYTLFRLLSTGDEFIESVGVDGVGNRRVGSPRVDALASQYLSDPRRRLAAPQSRRGLRAGHLGIREHAGRLEPVERLGDKSRVRLMPTQAGLELTARAPSVRQGRKGTVYQCRNRRRVQEPLELHDIERGADPGGADVGQGVDPDHTLLTGGQQHQIAPRHSRRLPEFPNSDGIGRKKSRGATHDEPW
jgi:hypothetical protein